MNLFYTDPAHITGSRLKLTGQEAVHAGTVLRYKTGDSISVTDGCGRLLHGNVVAVGRSELDVEIDRVDTCDRPVPGITIAIGLIKKRDRLEFAVEKAVELGAARIVLFRGEKSEKTGVKMSRIESTVLSAMKQSLRCWLPETEIYETLGDALETTGSAQLLFADETLGPGAVSTGTSSSTGERPEGNKEVEGEMTDIPALSQIQQIFAVIGPEGGFSKSEKALLISQGALRLSLGPYRLRTETAVIALVNRLMSGHTI